MTAVRVGSEFPHLLQLSSAGRQRYDLLPLTVIEPGEPLQNGVTASRCLEVAIEEVILAWTGKHLPCTHVRADSGFNYAGGGMLCEKGGAHVSDNYGESF